MEQTKKVRIGFVGVGGMGQCAHLRSYVTIPECEVTAIAEVRPKLRDAVARKYGVPCTYASAEEMLAKEELDGIVAVQQFTQHGQVVIPLYKAGVPVLTEKPLAASVEVGEKMLAALKAGGSWHMVGYHKRSDPATMYAKNIIETFKTSGEIGKLKYVRILMPSGDWVANGFVSLVKTEEKVPDLPCDIKASWSEPYVGFVNYYIHQVNLMRHLLGEPYRVVFADKSGVLLVAESRSGITGTIEMTPYRTTVDWQESALVCFEKGYVKLELPAPLAINRPGRVEILKDPGNGVTPQIVVPQIPWIDAMRQQAINFVRAIKHEIKPPCEAAEALEDLKVALQYQEYRAKNVQGTAMAWEL